MESNTVMSDLREALVELSHLEAVINLLSWDMEVSLPRAAGESRSEVISTVVRMHHDKFISKEFEDKLRRAQELLNSGDLSLDDQCIVGELISDFEKETKLPSNLVAELAKTAADNNPKWQEARRKSDFLIILPGLRKGFDLLQQKAECLGYKASPYDALLDEYEPGATVQETSELFGAVKNFLVPFVGRIVNSGVSIKRDFLFRSCPIRSQFRFARRVIKRMGVDFDRYKMDITAHPMCGTIHSNDVRISTRYKRHDLFGQCLMSVIHEAGHLLYEQGLKTEYFETALGEAVSMGIHEANSRLWENLVGRSREFWIYFYPRLQKNFPGVFDDISPEDFYRAINYVEPSLIRTEADEVTYNLHVIFRFEMEQAIFEGNLKVDKDLPAVWNREIKETFGLDVPDDASGILQDVHWYELLVGYFATYTKGNLYGPQFLSAARRDISSLDMKFALGNFSDLREWLREKIHIHGRRYTPDELVRRATGEKPSSQYFIDYIKTKYSEIYGL